MTVMMMMMMMKLCDLTGTAYERDQRAIWSASDLEISTRHVVEHSSGRVALSDDLRR